MVPMLKEEFAYKFRDLYVKQYGNNLKSVLEMLIDMRKPENHRLMDQEVARVIQYFDSRLLHFCQTKTSWVNAVYKLIRTVNVNTSVYSKLMHPERFLYDWLAENYSCHYRSQAVGHLELKKRIGDSYELIVTHIKVRA